MTNVKTIALAFLVIGTLSCNDQQSGDESSTSDTPATSPSMDTAASRASDTTNVPAMITAESDGSLVLSAQKGKGLGPSIKYMPEWRAFGWFTSSDSIQWDVDVKETGNYDVLLEWSVSDEEAGKEYLLRTNKDIISGTVEKSGSWETYKTKDIGDVKLDAGRQNVVFRSKKEFKKDGGLLDLRQIRFVKKS
jgi:hypothetical protein